MARFHTHPYTHPNFCTDHGAFTGPCSPERHRFLRFGKPDGKTGPVEDFFDKLRRFLDHTLWGMCRCCRTPIDYPDSPQ